VTKKDGEAPAWFFRNHQETGTANDEEKRPNKAPRKTNTKTTASEPPPPQMTALNDAQRKACEDVLNGRNIFLTGGGGVGKTFTINAIRAALLRNKCVSGPDQIAVLAPTGLAALHINGYTVNSFIGAGLADGSIKDVLDRAKTNKFAMQRIRQTKVLIIDEVSMLEDKLFEKLEAVCRAVRGSLQPFGGLQVMVCGDFFQLPPVSKGNGPKPFCFLSEKWSVLKLRVHHLKHVFRHRDPAFAALMLRARIGEMEEEDWAQLEKRVGVEPPEWKERGVKPTRLYSRCFAVDAQNEAELRKLPGADRIFKMQKGGATGKYCATSPAEETLRLRIGAQVMCVANLRDLDLVNGSRGVVTGFDDEKGYPIVQFVAGGMPKRIEPYTWQGKRGQLSVTQIPLRLAYALTIHKAQGMTLDAVAIALHGVFEAGQGYVALSRATGLEAITIVDRVSRDAIRPNKDVVSLYASLQDSHADGVMEKCAAKV
jgi:ATP-dependent DNA helicase PIF1